eukprot:17625_1
MEDKMKLAVDVCTKCNIESEPVWRAWGLSSLRAGRYEEAREKLRYSFESPTEKRKGGSDSSALLDEVINILENTPVVSVDALKRLQLTLKKSLSNTSSKVDRANEEETSNLLKQLHRATDQSSAVGSRDLDSVRYQ